MLSTLKYWIEKLIYPGLHTEVWKQQQKEKQLMALIDELNTAVSKVGTAGAKLAAAAAGLKGGLSASQVQSAIGNLNTTSAALDAETAALADGPPAPNQP